MSKQVLADFSQKTQECTLQCSHVQQMTCFTKSMATELHSRLSICVQVYVWTQFWLCIVTLWVCMNVRQSIISYLKHQEMESNIHKLPLDPFAHHGKYDIYAEELPTRYVQFIYNTADTNLKQVFPNIISN